MREFNYVFHSFSISFKILLSIWFFLNLAIFCFAITVKKPWNLIPPICSLMTSVINLRILFLSTARAATFLETTIATLKNPSSLFATSLSWSFSTLLPARKLILSLERLKRFLGGNIFHLLPTVSLFLLFCLLLFKTWRPSDERMRFLKPCFLALFLFLGWYVRFGMNHF